MQSEFVASRLTQATPASLLIALHCSGGSGRQWLPLAGALAPRFSIVTPDLSAGRHPHGGGDRPFQLTNEAQPFIEIVDAWEGPVHLVGHSYGGCIALRIAVERPARIASLSLYEPTAFHVLKAAGEDGRIALNETRAIAATVDRHVVTGAYRAAARCFIDYWGGPGAFDALKPESQVTLTRYAPQTCLDFHALIAEPTPLIAYRRLRMPSLIMRGEHAPAATQLIAHKLASVMNPGAVRVVPGAGHMGPVTHQDVVATMIADHIAASGPLEAHDRALIPKQAA